MKQSAKGGYSATFGPPGPLDRVLRDRPDYVLMGPYLLYLALLGLLQFRDSIGEEWVWVLHVLRGGVTLGFVWMIRRHFPPWGRAHVSLALLAGVACAALWVGGQHLFDSLGVPRRLPLPLFPGEPDSPEKINPFNTLGSGWVAWTTIITRIATACTAVPIVEELFWRSFLLRALIDWNSFEKVPLGKFTWLSFLGTSLISTIQHPDNWLVSVFCWFAFNGLMYWKKSVLFLVFVHAFTNLVLYVYVVWRGDWIFW